ncbi:MAG: hypothetical protein M0C28_42190 [Candidatus Moduliflexus flocculans]|nr:hypothetical protein [Candidatus Moduliflexus flocculans]
MKARDGPDGRKRAYRRNGPGRPAGLPGARRDAIRRRSTTWPWTWPGTPSTPRTSPRRSSSRSTAPSRPSGRGPSSAPGSTA